MKRIAVAAVLTLLVAPAGLAGSYQSGTGASRHPPSAWGGASCQLGIDPAVLNSIVARLPSICLRESFSVSLGLDNEERSGTAASYEQVDISLGVSIRVFNRSLGTGRGEVELVSEGYGFTEGPQWMAKGGVLRFTADNTIFQVGERHSHDISQAELRCERAAHCSSSRASSR